MAETTATDHLEIEIKPFSPHRTSIDQIDGSLLTQTASFFRSRSKSNQNTWIISVFVVIHLIVFAATMIVNDCPQNSNGDCILDSIGRFSFQPLHENPLLGPSSSTLNRMGALQRKLVFQQHQIWRLVTSPWLHGGIFDLFVNLACVIFIGIHLEQEFGSWRVGIIYTFSAFVGSLMASLFVNNNPAVGSSGALFGMLGALLSAVIRNWRVYTDKYPALVIVFSLAVINSALGLLPHVDNFANIGGFISGILLGFMLFYNPHLGQVPQNKKGLFEYNEKTSLNLKHKLDKPVTRSISLALFSLILAGGLVGVLHGVNANEYCSWCSHVDCAPSEKWYCSEKAISCKVTRNAGRLTLTCNSSDKYRVFPFTNISKARIGDLCTQLCS